MSHALDIFETPVTVTSQPKFSITLIKFFKILFKNVTFTFGEVTFTFGEIRFTLEDSGKF